MSLKLSGLRINLLFAVILLFSTWHVSAETLEPISIKDEICPVEKRPVYENGCIKANVSLSQGLPEEFYGTWTVVSSLIETTSPELFRMRSSDIWTFQRQGDMITLSNPLSGATASITVNEVNGNTAKFSRISSEDEIYEIETPEITVEGESFTGTDLIVMEHYRNGKKVAVDRVKYKVRGVKISGPALRDLFAR